MSGKVWEYLEWSENDSIYDLEDLGNDGWELVCGSMWNGVLTQGVFKRERTPEQRYESIGHGRVALVEDEGEG